MRKEFVDTNVWVYANDAREPGKRDQARIFLKELSQRASIVVSNQVLIEFFSIATRKLCIPGPEARALASRLVRLDVVEPTKELVMDAIDLVNQAQLSPWDALIICCAAARRCTCVWSEDLNAGQKILGVEIRNPFTS